MNNQQRLIDEILPVIHRLKEIQAERGLTDRQLLTEFPDLGSTKTWRHRLLAEKWEELNLERTSLRLRRVAAILDGGSPEEIFFPDLPFALEMRARIGLLERQTNDRRILACLAPNGCGKSALARWAVAQHRSRRAYVRIRPTWREKLLHLCTGMARALGRDSNTTNVAEAETSLISMLSGEPKTVFIDQAHEGGVKLLHLLRALVDETPSRFVYLAYDTTFRRVLTGNTDALAESQAFLGRCIKPVFDLYRAGTSHADCALILQRKAGLPEPAAAAVSARVVPLLRSNTNLRLLEDAIEAARAENDDRDPSAEQVVRKVEELAGETRKGARPEEEG